MQFSNRLIASKVEIEVNENGAMVVVKGEIITLYEGRQWTAMCQVLMFDGPFAGRVWTLPVSDVMFPDATAGRE